ncbi:hypothetical protein DAPPUDRAFT_346581 [Daphnia pulex]|uniref:Uncharacterized protein n=1 Tax=Daphnia pulex TaxID=6669 RepID=E9I7Y4_DAPPU|nr:hypothetical protein DAPPUDRAFT_346581 [Daphnia pulex]|eukprot:EFX59896.1 hypothetical protein DAPPUDRAFT_346581 [Daphnia pulex]
MVVHLEGGLVRCREPAAIARHHLKGLVAPQPLHAPRTRAIGGCRFAVAAGFTREEEARRRGVARRRTNHAHAAVFAGPADVVIVVARGRSVDEKTERVVVRVGPRQVADKAHAGGCSNEHRTAKGFAQAVFLDGRWHAQARCTEVVFQHRGRDDAGVGEFGTHAGSTASTVGVDDDLRERGQQHGGNRQADHHFDQAEATRATTHTSAPSSWWCAVSLSPARTSR